MALIKTDWSPELQQVRETLDRAVDEKLGPLVDRAIRQAGQEMNKVVGQAGDRLETTIQVLSEEVHNQRQLTREDLVFLIDYASDRLAHTLDARLAQAKAEASSFMTEKVEQLRQELEDAAVRSRRTLYANVAISVAGALAMAAVGLVYKKISLGEVDPFAAFRVLLLSLATGTGLFAALKGLGQWLALNRHKRNLAAVALQQLGPLRPQGTLGLFVLAVVLLLAWAGATFWVA
ncbi:hypothetical protein [Ideonella livida]|uniref:Uncharacterized protein n=1 Tax=Ideonella livida TaxID=2707176 RepID=A0A7C9PJS3_9BURK|nr:hypothetical protein [Ideonella livida]NDY93775.1 hypothetical protein [Ideonella livida]